MIYENIQPLMKNEHKDLAVKIDSLNFTSGLTSIPLVAAEILQAAIEYPVFFSGPNESGDHTPLAIVGIKPGENLMLNESGKFETRYLPAFIRRYPFVYGGAEDAKQLTICVDMDSSTIIKDGSEGNRLFKDNGEETDYFKGIMKFLQEYQQRAEITKMFCKTLKDLNLLEPMQAEIKFKDNESENLTVSGFYVVSRDKLKEIPDDKALDLFKKGGLELIYAHLQSLDNLNALISKKDARLKKAKGN